MIKRVTLCIGSIFWDEEIEARTEKILKEYEIQKEQIISIVHCPNDGHVFLYYLSNH